MELVTFWHPAYGLQGLVKLAAAVISAAVAVMLWPLLPRLVALPSPDELRRKNAALEAEIARRRAVEAELREAHASLEDRVRERTAALESANAALRRSQGRLALALDAAEAGLLELDLRDRVVAHCPRARSVLALPPGLSPASSLDAALAQLEEGDRRELLMGLDELRRGKIEKLHRECRRRSAGGKPAWVALALQVVERDAAGAATQAVGVCVDVTARKETEARLAHLAMHDGLTGLPNRIYLWEMLRREQARAARSGGSFALLLADLDRFKQVNDRWGHAAGDALLKEVARRLAGAVRESDAVARLGGDEFAILLAEPTSDAALRSLAARLVAAVEAPIEIGGQPVQVGISIGAAVCPDDARDLDLLFARADLALYAAKARGRSGLRRFHAAMVRRERPVLPIGMGLLPALSR